MNNKNTSSVRSDLVSVMITYEVIDEEDDRVAIYTFETREQAEAFYEKVESYECMSYEEKHHRKHPVLYDDDGGYIVWPEFIRNYEVYPQAMDEGTGFLAADNPVIQGMVPPGWSKRKPYDFMKPDKKRKKCAFVDDEAEEEESDEFDKPIIKKTKA